MTTTGFEKKLHAAVPGIKKSKAQRLALKLVKRAEHMQEQFDFFAELRILGITTDHTARDAINNLEEAAA